MGKMESTRKHTLNAQNSAMNFITDLLKSYELGLEGKSMKYDVLGVIWFRLPDKSRLVKPALRLNTCIHSKGNSKEHVGLMMDRARDVVTSDREKWYFKLSFPQTLLTRSAIRSLCQIA